MAPLPCVICGTELKPAFPDTDDSQPLDATTFIAGGQYGSIYDPMDSRLSLEINVCDDCLSARADRVTERTTTQPPAEVRRAPWGNGPALAEALTSEFDAMEPE